MILRKLSIIAVLSTATCPLTVQPISPIELASRIEVQVLVQKLAEMLTKMGDSARVLIQVILKDVAPKVAEEVVRILRALGYRI